MRILKEMFFFSFMEKEVGKKRDALIQIYKKCEPYTGVSAIPVHKGL
jgi:hypothetical protein